MLLKIELNAIKNPLKSETNKTSTILFDTEKGVKTNKGYDPNGFLNNHIGAHTTAESVSTYLNHYYSGVSVTEINHHV